MTASAACQDGAQATTSVASVDPRVGNNQQSAPHAIICDTSATENARRRRTAVWSEVSRLMSPPRAINSRTIEAPRLHARGQCADTGHAS